MNKKLLLKYILMYIPMVVGIGMFSDGTINLFSSLLLFGGGYFAIKNTFDYRLVRKHISKSKMMNDECINNISLNEGTTKESEKTKSITIKPMKRNAENIIGIKRTRRYTRVRRRY